ncbi:HIT family protein [Bacillus gaemokensis]|uniref:HIT family hydrolase n=1 Tax=Bacillus gaemokensis TaxID=574375 RepID=A0A073KB83_9BACI|nr:HIT family protein [Bacillus gaemokensis]KEK23820.1 HIT family hydrolase [Bacillus gaemokensis]KYG37967.1 HIT family hydrolase [Bacillus gaemokensis]
MKLDNECLGCKLANNDELVYQIYENDYVTCFLDHAPFNSGHTLIVPKQHFLEVDELDTDTAKAIMDASKLISKAIKLLYKPDGITICQNGGIFNELTHYHMHVVPRYKNQPFADFYIEQSIDRENKIHNFSDTKRLLKETINQMTGIEKA